MKRWIMPAVTLAALAALLHGGANLWKAYWRKAAPAEQIQRPQLEAVSFASRSAGIRIYSPPPPAAMAAAKPAQNPPPEIKLTGLIMFMGAPAMSRAFVLAGSTAGDSAEKVMREGEKTEQGLKLVSVLQRSAIFDYEGARIETPLAGEKLSAPPLIKLAGAVR